MNATERYKAAAEVIEFMAAKGVSMEDLAQIMLDMAKKPNAKKTTGTKVYKQVTQILKEIGIRASMQGFDFLRQAIILTLNSECQSKLHKEIYSQIATQYNVTKAKVEHGIRVAIENAMNNADTINMEAIEHYFGNTISNMKGKPTNKEFIYMIADYIRTENM